jgi:DNA polymerase-1
MLKVKQTWIVDNVADLPSLDGVENLYMDFETKPAVEKREAFFPYLGDRICGIALTRDDEPDAWYLPIRHHNSRANLPLANVLAWMKDAMRVTRWINHNVKFDAHFAVVDGCIFNNEFIDTQPLSKLIDSDRMNHKLKPLARDWLGLKMDEADRVDAYLKGAKTKDYSRIPIDLLGEYAGMDVISTRLLYKYILARIPPEMQTLYNTEVKLTSVLFDMERNGLQVDREEVNRERIKSLKKLIRLADELHEMTGREYVDSNANIYDILINQCGLPVVAYTKPKKDEDTGVWTPSNNPSFDKEAMKLYKVHPQVTADPKLKLLVDMMGEYRSEAHFKSLFLDSYAELMDDKGLLHPSYNQIIRTGRMATSNPNSSQLNKRAKKLIHPKPGCAFLAADASQIEFRFIIHYIQDAAAIDAYRNDPNTDFHAWVAKECGGIARGAAKNINFALAFGAGKKKILAMLAGNPEIIEEVGNRVNLMVEEGVVPKSERGAVYRKLVTERVEEIYHDYHERFPSLKAVSNDVTRICKARGFVFNAFGRRRKLAPKHAHKGFNSLNQGGAMDYIKTRMIATSERHSNFIRQNLASLLINVHDENVYEGPTEFIKSPQTWKWFQDELCIQPIPFRVPFAWQLGVSEQNWAEAREEKPIIVDGKFVGGAIPK